MCETIIGRDRGPLINQGFLGVVRDLAVQSARTRTYLGPRSGMGAPPSTDPGDLADSTGSLNSKQTKNGTPLGLLQYVSLFSVFSLFFLPLH